MNKILSFGGGVDSTALLAIHLNRDEAAALTGRTREETLAELAAGNPQRRLVEPHEVSATVLWLALPSSSSITGQSIAVAGGEVM